MLIIYVNDISDCSHLRNKFLNSWIHNLCCARALQWEIIFKNAKKYCNENNKKND